MSGEYNFFTLLAATLGAYGVSLLLVRKKSITLQRHRKIWNYVLLASFIVSGMSGMLMSLLIDSGVRITNYSTVLWLHVELGIVMAVISVFHVLWHGRYYLRSRG